MKSRPALKTRLSALACLVLLSLGNGCDGVEPIESEASERGGPFVYKFTLADFGDGGEDASNQPRDLYETVGSCETARFWVNGESDNVAGYWASSISTSEGAIVLGPYPDSQVAIFKAEPSNGAGFFDQFGLDLPLQARKLMNAGYTVEHVGLLVSGYSAHDRDELLPGGHEQLYKARVTARMRKGSSVRYTGIDWHEANLRLEMYDCELPTIDPDLGDISPG